MKKRINKTIYKQAVIICISIFVFNCKSTKGVIASGEASEKLSAKQVIKQHEKNNADFKTLQARVRIDLIQGEQEQGASFNLRIEKDKVIWLNAPLGLARMMITPNKVRFYNKQDNEYFDGDYKLLSDFVGVELDFFKVQNILFGQAIFDLKSETHTVSINKNAYVLNPKTQNALLELFYVINPSHFKIDRLELFQQLKKRLLEVDYKSYQEIESQILPKIVNIKATENSEMVLINMDYKSIALNEELRFPFKIPKGYKEIVIN